MWLGLGVVNMSCCSVNVFDFVQGKLHKHFNVSVNFPAQNGTSNITCSALIKHLLSTRATTLWKMLMNVKFFKAQILTGNSTGNVLVSHALNMSSSLSKWACSIESRFIVKGLFLRWWPLSTMLGGSFNNFKCQYQGCLNNTIFLVWSHVLYVEHTLYVITNCGKSQWVTPPLFSIIPQALLEANIPWKLLFLS